MENNVLKKYSEDANHLVSQVLRYVMVLILIVEFASLCGVFIIDESIMLIMTVISLICLMIPTFLFDILKITKPWTECLVLALITIYVGVLYSILSYHVVMIFTFPIILASLYNKKNYVIFVVALTAPTLVISHLIALKLKIVPDEPLITFEGVIKFGIVPRLIEISCIAIICVAVAWRIQRLIKDILNYTRVQRKQTEVMHIMIESSEYLLSSRTFQDATLYTANSIRDMIMKILETSKQIDYIAGFCLEPDNHYIYLLENIQGKSKEKFLNLAADDELVNELDWVENPVRRIIYEDDFCLMQFYSKEKLLGFVKLNIGLVIHNNQIIDILHIAYNNSSKVMSNVELSYFMHETQKRLVHSLAMISESKSEQTGQHIYRVGEYMRAFGQELNLDENECEVLSLAAMLHDVGKMAIPSEILDKPGKLTKEEFDIIKTHVEEGRKLLQGCPGEMMELGMDIAYEHHEKWDGTGYLKKKGEEINEYATYVAVIDVFDALISKRSYKDAWQPEDAYNEIIKCTGTHFSPKAVEIFKRVYPKLLEIAKLYPDTNEE